MSAAAAEHRTLLLSIVIITKEAMASAASANVVPGKALLKQRLAMFTQLRKDSALAQNVQQTLTTPDVSDTDIMESVPDADLESSVAGDEEPHATADQKSLAMMKQLVHLSGVCGV